MPFLLMNVRLAVRELASLASRRASSGRSLSQKHFTEADLGRDGVFAVAGV
jgi:hypothetical protein